MKGKKNIAIIFGVALFVLLTICIVHAISKRTVSNTQSNASNHEQKQANSEAEMTNYSAYQETSDNDISAVEDVSPDFLKITKEQNEEFIKTTRENAPYLGLYSFEEDGKMKTKEIDPVTGLNETIDIEDWTFYEDVTPILEGFDIIRDEKGRMRIVGTLSFTQGDIQKLEFIVKDSNGEVVVFCEKGHLAEDDEENTEWLLYSAYLGSKVDLWQEFGLFSARHAFDELNGKYTYELLAAGDYFAKQIIISGELEISNAATEALIKQEEGMVHNGGTYNTVGKDGRLIDFTGGDKDVVIFDDYTFGGPLDYEGCLVLQGILDQMTPEHKMAQVFLKEENDIGIELVPKIAREGIASNNVSYRVYDYGGIEYYMKQALVEPSFSMENIDNVAQLQAAVKNNGGTAYVYFKEMVSFLDRCSEVIRGCQNGYELNYDNSAGAPYDPERDIYKWSRVTGYTLEVDQGWIVEIGHIYKDIEDYIELTKTFDNSNIHDKLEYGFNNQVLVVKLGEDGSLSVFPVDGIGGGRIMDYTVGFEFDDDIICNLTGWWDVTLIFMLDISFKNINGEKCCFINLRINASDETNLVADDYDWIVPKQDTNLRIDASTYYK